jgi:hypothetical protein
MQRKILLVSILMIASVSFGVIGFLFGRGFPASDPGIVPDVEIAGSKEQPLASEESGRMAEFLKKHFPSSENVFYATVESVSKDSLRVRRHMDEEGVGDPIEIGMTERTVIMKRATCSDEFTSLVSCPEESVSPDALVSGAKAVIYIEEAPWSEGDGGRRLAATIRIR